MIHLKTEEQINSINNDKFIIVDINNNQVCETIFDEIDTFCFNQEIDKELYPAPKSGKYGRSFL